MRVIVKHTKTIDEYNRERQELASVAQARYADHANGSEWMHGAPVCVWRACTGQIMVEYADGYAE